MLRHGMPLPDDLADAVAGRRKVLVVGEPGPAREGAVRQLAAAGFAVEQASPGFSAGAAAARYEPDAFLLHASAPDGGEALRGIRADRELGSVPVVAVGRPGWREALAEAGCAEAVGHPPEDGALAAAVQRALAASEAGMARSPAEARVRRRRPGRPAAD